MTTKVPNSMLETPGGGGVTDGTKGEIVVSAGGTNWALSSAAKAALPVSTAQQTALDLKAIDIIAGLSVADATDVADGNTLKVALGKLQAKWNAIAATVRGTVLTGIDLATNAAVTAADTVMGAIGKLSARLEALITTVAGKADALSQSLLVSGATLTRATHLNRPLIINDAGASTQAFTNAAGSGAVAGDSYYLRNTGAGTFTATGAITAAPGCKLTAGSGESFSADYDSVDDAWVSTTLIVPVATVTAGTGIAITGTATNPIISTTGGSGDPFAALKSRWGITKPAGDNNAAWSSAGQVNPVAFDTSTLAVPTVNDDVLGRLSPLQYTSASSAVNRGAGANWVQGPLIDISSTGIELFPIGFTFAMTDANPTDGCAFVGAGTPTVATEPSSRLDIIGFGFDVADANWQIMHNDGSGVATKIDLGASFVRATRTPYLFVLDRPSVAATYSLYAVNLATGVVSATSVLSTNLPSGDRSSWNAARWSHTAVAFQAQCHIGGMQRGKIA